MNRRKSIVCFLLLFAIAAQIGCYEKDILAGLQAATALNNAVVDARTAGKISDAKWNSIQPKLKQFHDAIDKGYVLLALYHQSKNADTKQALTALLLTLTASKDTTHPSLFDEISAFLGVK